MVSSVPRQSALVIGVVGHRPNGFGSIDERRLRGQIREVLTLGERIGENVSLVSPIAEGADRLVAREALTLGIPLTCILPFARDVYMKDFATPESINDYQDLLRRAQSVRELAGLRGSEDDLDAAYACLSDELVAEIDLLIAIWDGNKARGVGGTAMTVDQALAKKIPVVWIDVHQPHDVRVLSRGEHDQTRVLDLARLPDLLVTRE